MNVELVILDLTQRGVQVAIGEGQPFWLPKSAPGVEWGSPPEIGDCVYVRLPKWLIAKHKQLTEYQYQSSLALYAPDEFDRGTTQGSPPMAYNNDMTGVLFKNDRRENDRHPLYKGSCEINGRKFWISAWLKDGKNGKFMSLAFKPADEQRQEQQRQPEPQPNAYAAARGRAEPRREPERGGPDWDSQIPFLPAR